MYKLIACKFKTFGACPWPTCPEGGAGQPSYEKYEDCPVGWVPQASPSNTSLNGEENICVQARNECDPNLRHNGRLTDLACTVSMPRQLRAKPYNFQITNSQTNEIETFWFSLTK
jgi:hypothetical protein